MHYFGVFFFFFIIIGVVTFLFLPHTHAHTFSISSWPRIMAFMLLQCVHEMCKKEMNKNEKFQQKVKLSVRFSCVFNRCDSRISFSFHFISFFDFLTHTHFHTLLLIWFYTPFHLFTVIFHAEFNLRMLNWSTLERHLQQTPSYTYTYIHFETTERKKRNRIKTI